jgi:hypothetical protein
MVLAAPLLLLLLVLPCLLLSLVLSCVLMPSCGALLPSSCMLLLPLPMVTLSVYGPVARASGAAPVAPAPARAGDVLCRRRRRLGGRPSSCSTPSSDRGSQLRSDSGSEAGNQLRSEGESGDRSETGDFGNQLPKEAGDGGCAPLPPSPPLLS